MYRLSHLRGQFDRGGVDEPMDIRKLAEEEFGSPDGFFLHVLSVHSGRALSWCNRLPGSPKPPTQEIVQDGGMAFLNPSLHRSLQLLPDNRADGADQFPHFTI